MMLGSLVLVWWVRCWYSRVRAWNLTFSVAGTPCGNGCFLILCRRGLFSSRKCGLPLLLTPFTGLLRYLLALLYGLVYGPELGVVAAFPDGRSTGDSGSVLGKSAGDRSDSPFFTAYSRSYDRSHELDGVRVHDAVLGGRLCTYPRSLTPSVAISTFSPYCRGPG